MERQQIYVCEAASLGGETLQRSCMIFCYACYGASAVPLQGGYVKHRGEEVAVIQLDSSWHSCSFQSSIVIGLFLLYKEKRIAIITIPFSSFSVEDVI